MIKLDIKWCKKYSSVLNGSRCHFPFVTLRHSTRFLDCKVLGDIEEVHAKKTNAGALLDDEEDTRKREEEVTVEFWYIRLG